jgi:hypothetical protein
MIQRLAQIAEVQLGYQHRETVSHVEHGSHRLIQGKDIVRAEAMPDGGADAAGWRVRTDQLDRVTPKGDADRYRLQPGDVLFVSRGTTNIAVPLTAETVRPVPENWDDLIAAYTFYILRPDTSRIVPEFLSWFINQPPAQSYLVQQSRGTLVKLVPKSVFEELQVPVPPIPLQRQIMEIERLRAREESLLKRLIEARRRVVQRSLLDAIG